MALITLHPPRAHAPAARRTKLVLAALGIFGASLFLGDSMITPAISVLSAVEGLKVADAVAGASGRPDHGGDHRRAVPAAADRHRGGRPPVRPGDGRLVPHHRRVRRRRHRRAPRDPQGAVADLRAGLLLQPLLDRVLRAGRGRARGHRRGGAVRRHGALRPRADHARLAAARVPGLHPELHGPGRADPRRPRQHQQPVLPARSRLGTLAAGLPGHRGDRHRVAGGHHRRLLGRPPGRRSSATCRGCASRTPRRRRSGRSTCRGSTGCCWSRCSRWSSPSRPPPRWPSPSAWRSPARSRSRRCCSSTSSATSGASRSGSSCAGGRLPADRRPAVPRRQPDQARARGVAAAADRRDSRSPCSPPGSAAARSSRAGASTTRARCARSSTTLHERTPPVLRVPGTAVFLNRTKVTAPLAMRASVEHLHALNEHVVILSIETLAGPARRGRTTAS